MRFYFSKAFIVSLCCANVLSAAVYNVTVATDDPTGTTPGTLSWAIQQVNTAGFGDITFTPTNITLAGNLYPITAAGPTTVNSAGGPYPFVTVNGGSAYAGFLSQGTCRFENIVLQNMLARGGNGGNGFQSYNDSYGNTFQAPSGGGGGGLGAGAGIFVDSGSVTTIAAVAFSSCTAQGGNGGNSYNVNVGGNMTWMGSGGGGGGGMNAGSANPGGNGGSGQIQKNANGGSGGGGGGGVIAVSGSSPQAGSGAQNASGGNGGGPSGGAGGSECYNGSNVFTAFSGGGGGGSGGTGCTPADLSGGDGADFGGGGGSGGGNDPFVGATDAGIGGDGGFGGGGGGGGTVVAAPSSDPTIGCAAGSGGYGAGSGGGGGQLISSQYGQSINSYGANGGSGYGGGVFIRSGGTLNVDGLFIPPLFTANTVVAGQGSPSGSANQVAGTAGAAYGQDIFIQSGGVFNFLGVTGLTIGSASSTSSIYAESGSSFSLQGGSQVTLAGANTLPASTISIDGTSTLTISNTAAVTGGSTLVLNQAGATLDFAISLMGSSAFSPALQISAATNLSAQAGTTVQLSGQIQEAAIVTLNGLGTIQLTNGANTFGSPIDLQSGILKVSDGSQVTGLPSLIFNGGNFQVGATPVGSFGPNFLSTFQLNSPATIIVDQTVAASIDGQIIGVGDLTITGQGALTLTNSGNSYSGATTLGDGIAGSGNLVVPSPLYLGMTPSLTFNGGSLSILNTTTTLALPITVNSITGTGGNTLAMSGGTISGNITGPANSAFTVQNPSGTSVTFTGINGAFLGTLNFGASGTYQLNGFGAVPGGPMTINAASTLSFSGVAGTIPGPISGFGGVSIVNGSNVTFSSDNTYQSTTTVDSTSTLNITAVGAFLPGGYLTNNGTVNFSQTGELVLGVLEGTGTINLSNGGDLLINTPAVTPFSGTAAVQWGSLQIGVSDPFPNASVVLASSMDLTAALELTNIGSQGTFSSPIAVQGPNTATIQADSGSQWLLSSVITGDAGGADLNIISEGDMTWGIIPQGDVLPDSSQTIGTFQCNTVYMTGFNGSLTVSGQLYGTEVVSITNVTYAPGSHGIHANGCPFPAGSWTQLSNHTLTLLRTTTLNLDGMFNQSSSGKTVFNVHNTINGNIVAYQGANLAGLGVANISPGVYLPGMRFTLLDTVESPLNGEMEFSILDAPTGNPIPPGFFSVTHSQNPHIYLNVLQQFVLQGVTVTGHNANQVLHYLQNATYTVGGDLYNVVSLMSDLGSAALSDALDQLQPAQFGAFGLVSANANSLAASLLSRKLIDACCTHLEFEPAGCGDCKTTLFFEPYGLFTTQSNIGDQLGFGSNGGGAMLGAGFCLPHGFGISCGAGYDINFLNWKHNRGSGNIQSIYLGVGADWRHGIGFIDLSLIGGLDLLSGSRHIHFIGVDRHAKHFSYGHQFTSHLGGGADIPVASATLTPFGTIDYLALHQNSFTEHGADSLNLHVHGKNMNVLRSEAGLRASKSYKVGAGCIAPTVWASYINECLTPNGSYTAALVGQPANFDVNTFYRPINLASLGLDLSWQINDDSGMAGRYSVEFNGTVLNQKVDARFQWRF